jgi:hypothetical protein
MQSGSAPVIGASTAVCRSRHFDEHFSAIVGALNPIGIAILGLTPIGRATVQVLGLNEEMRQLLRYELWSEGLYVAEPRGG